MAFTGTNICGSKATIGTYSGADKASLALDCVLVAALVSLVCIVVIGKIDLRLGEVGTMSNPWMQGMLGAGIGIFVVDAVTMLIKHLSSRGQRKPEPQAAAASEPAAVGEPTSIAYGEWLVINERGKRAWSDWRIQLSHGPHRESVQGTRTDESGVKHYTHTILVDYDIRNSAGVLYVRFAKSATVQMCSGTVGQPPQHVGPPKTIQDAHPVYVGFIKFMTDPPSSASGARA